MSTVVLVVRRLLPRRLCRLMIVAVATVGAVARRAVGRVRGMTATVDQLQILLHLGLGGQVGQNGCVAQDTIVQGRLCFDSLITIRVSGDCGSVVQEEVE